MSPLAATLAVLLFISMLATAGVLALGMGAFFKGGDFNRKYGNQLMQARVLMQGISLLLFAALMLASGR